MMRSRTNSVNIFRPYPIFPFGFSYQYRNPAKESLPVSSRSSRVGFLPRYFSNSAKQSGVSLARCLCSLANRFLVDVLSCLNKSCTSCVSGAGLLCSSKSKHFKYCSKDNDANTTYPITKCGLSERDSDERTLAQPWKASPLLRISKGLINSETSESSVPFAIFCFACVLIRRLASNQFVF